MEEIRNISGLQMLVQSGETDWAKYGNVYAREQDGLILFNYKSSAQFEDRWNFFERVSRGLILDRTTGNVVARPFDKFFNWGEGERTTNAPIRSITEKMDGSLGILYFHRGEWKIATRGSFDSEQAIWATEHLNKSVDLRLLPMGWTLLFEIIYPGNRVVVDYGDEAGLYLLTARDTPSGRHLSMDVLKGISSCCGFPMPRIFSNFDSVDELLTARENLDANSEGWVAEFADGSRFKFKGTEYLRLHKLISGLSFNKALECVASNTVDQILEIVPDEFLSEFNDWIAQIEQKVVEVKQTVEEQFSAAPKATRKEYALWVKENCPQLAAYMFARLDERDFDQLIYKYAFDES